VAIDNVPMTGKLNDLEAQMNEFLIGAPGSPVQVQRQPKLRGLGLTSGVVAIYQKKILHDWVMPVNVKSV